MAGDCDYHVELNLIIEELSEVEVELKKLRKRQQELIERRDHLIELQDLEKSEQLGERNWDLELFDWTERLHIALNGIFNIKEYRPQQLAAMNATLAGNHALVVMPTGAGKSLCFQLPALINDGITIVVSPLISLMEDQVMSLTMRGIQAKLMTSTSSKEETNSALNDMTDKNSGVKLLYVTPERFAKSKRFMTKLQTCFTLGRLQRIAIDEVHCCSQWGHDFRPDYKFLGNLSAMFPNVPILGLTATATSRVLMDVQKMLDIRGCLIIKSSFNRPNLYYHIIDKPSSAEECCEILEKLLKYRYKDQSGIIYATSIKDCEDLALNLRKRGLKVAFYHASVESQRRSEIHTKWTQKYYQAIVATVAFGLGIDKPDVRYVIHHSLSKAMESYYQESGRAGRDGSRAECVMMYRMQDIFRVSTMVFSSAGSLEHLYGMIRYCLNSSTCRRKIIASHFDEGFESSDCQNMCDRCCQANKNERELFIECYCRDMYKIINFASKLDTQVTAQKLIDSWFGKGAANLRVPGLSPPSFSRIQGETIVTFLLVEGYLKEYFHYTAYTTISYIKIGTRSPLLDDKDHKIKMKTKNFHKLNLEERAPTDFVAPTNNTLAIKSKLDKDFHESRKKRLTEKPVISVDKTKQKSSGNSSGSSKLDNSLQKSQMKHSTKQSVAVDSKKIKLSDSSSDIGTKSRSVKLKQIDIQPVKSQDVILID